MRSRRKVSDESGSLASAHPTPWSLSYCSSEFSAYNSARVSPQPVSLSCAKPSTWAPWEPRDAFNLLLRGHSETQTWSRLSQVAHSWSPDWEVWTSPRPHRGPKLGPLVNCRLAPLISTNANTILNFVLSSSRLIFSYIFLLSDVKIFSKVVHRGGILVSVAVPFMTHISVSA